MAGHLERLTAALRAEGGLLAGALTARGDASTPHGDLAAAGPLAIGREAELGLVVEAVREGYLLHYGTPRVLDASDPDLALLAGDRLYALALARLADAGDLASVTELADVIALSAAAHAAADLDLADATWSAGAHAVGWGTTPQLVSAKAAARAHEPGASVALRAATRHVDGHLAR